MSLGINLRLSGMKSFLAIFSLVLALVDTGNVRRGFVTGVDL